ncbi:FAD-dependent oxidoreductase [Chloroflexota bacterium]
MFDHLLKPGQIGKMPLKNKMKFAATTTNFCHQSGAVTDREIAFLAERARGGGAIVCSGGGYPHILGKAYIGQMGLHDDKLVPGLKKLAQAIHDNGAKASCEILHGGAYAHPAEYGIEGLPVGPTAMPPKLPRYSPCRELTTNEIKELVELYGQAARRIKDAGFDAIEIGCLTGYLLVNFLLPRANKRTDKYGGSLENRARFTVEIIQRIREEVGADYPIIMRALANDLLQEGGNTEEEYIEVAKMFAATGVDSLSLGVGTHESDFPAITSEIEPGHWLYLAEKWKRAGIKVPLMLSYRVSRPELADKAIADGIIDFWEMSRPLIADPYLPTKVAQGHPEDIAICPADSACLSNLLLEKPIACILNPMVGREGEEAFQIRPAETRRKVIVVGGGPAGMEAARVAALRGHQIVLHEEKDRLGGQLQAASVAPYKDEINCLTDYLTTQVSKAGVEVRLNSKVNAQSIEQSKPDVVIVATGSNPLIPDIPGVDRGNVVTALDVLTGKKQTGDRVVIVGGGMVGCEVAEFLAGEGKKVTVLEMQKRIGQGIIAITRWRVIQRLSEAGVSLETKTKAEEITESGVQANREGLPQLFPADTVVLATSMTPNKGLLQELEGRVPSVHAIGDCLEPRQIGEAMEEGFRLGAAI